jgi:hypothetical protein
MDQPVQDRVGDGRVCDVLVPVFGWELGSDEGSPPVIPIVKDLQ